ncbi:MAG: TonB-dependent receptor [Ignavibacteriales bacterium]|nr:TonB-dependent receptor [Ignavibacteriales bacterium]
MKSTFLIILLCFCISIFAQKKGSVKGKVIDKKTKQPLIGANVSVQGTSLGASTDGEGYYLISNVDEDIYKLQVSYLGYNNYLETDVRVIRNKTTYVKEIELVESFISSKEVNVTAGVFNEDKEFPVSAYGFEREEIKRAPGAAGDIFRAVETIPGVSSSGGEFSSFSVRGGAPRENIIMVDNIPFSSISHFTESSGNEEIQGGRFSIFASGLVEKAKFQGGGFGARFGGKNASLLDLSIKEGNRESFSLNGTYDLLGWEANYDGPSYLFKNSSMVFSARHQDFKTLLDMINELSHGHPKYSDFLFKFTSEINQSHKISLLSIYSTETYQRTVEHIFKLKNPTDPDLVNQNEDKILTGLNWRWLTSPSSVLNTNVYFNKIDRTDKVGTAYLDKENGIAPQKEKVSTRFPIIQDNSVTDVFGAKSELSYSVSKNVLFSSGIQFQTSKRNFSLSQFGEDTIYTYNSNDLPYMNGNKYYITNPADVNFSFKGRRNEAAAYTEVSFSPIECLNINSGLRFEYDDMIKKSFISPRISGSYQLSPIQTINFAAGIYNQAPEIEYLTTNGKNRNLTNEKAAHFIFGFTNYLSEDIKLTIEGYYKQLWDLLVKPAYGSNAMVNNGKGYVYGLDFGLLKRFSDKYYGQINYSYSVSKRKNADAMAYYNSSFNQPHIFNVLIGYQFNDNWSISVKWKYATGRPSDTYIVYSDVLNNPNKVRYSMEILAKNNKRFDDYHALNFRIDYRHQFISNLALIAFIDVINVYDNKNTFQETLNSRTGEVIKEGSMVYPTFGFKFEF